jgi:hypothetical protein
VRRPRRRLRFGGLDGGDRRRPHRCDTVLVERFGHLGGISTAVLDTFYAFFTPGPDPQRVVGGIPVEIVERLTDLGMAFERPNTYGAGTGITYDPRPSSASGRPPWSRPGRASCSTP